MTIRNYDAEFCGKIPLHNVNLIQPHGYLLVLDPEHLEIVQVSENIAALFNQPLDAIIGTTINDWLDEPLHTERLTGNHFSSQKIPFRLRLADSLFLALIHMKGPYLLVELSPTSEEKSFLEIYQALRYNFAELEQKHDLPTLLSATAHQFQLLSGFDRVMIYQFDENWNGKVVAEANHSGKVSYLGQQFPASDIPKSARELYKKSPYRLIPTSHYEPVKLYPIINPLSMSFVDLSDCHLRSVAPVHLEYLHNMEVDASMSVRLLVNDTLWGLISFHHNTPRYPNFETCCQFELLADFVSKQLANLLNAETFAFNSTISTHKNAILRNLYREVSLEKALFDNEYHLLKLFSAQGAVLIYDNKYYGTGAVPTEEQLQNLVFWLQEKQLEPVFVSNSMTNEFEEAQAYSNMASGLLAIEIDKHKGNYLLCFRSEHPYTIDWGGNPNEAVNFEQDAGTYHPRNSFRIWKQEVKNSSIPWKEEEKEAAHAIRLYIFEYLSKNAQE